MVVELRVIDSFIAWITQINYAHDEIENMHNEFADYDKYYQLISEAEEGLKSYRKLHPYVTDFL